MASAAKRQKSKPGTSLGDRSLPHLRTVREKAISNRFDDSGGVRRARVGSELASVVDVLPASRQNQHSEVVQPWRRECRPSRGLVATCWSHSGNARTSHFTVADSTATHRQSWRSHLPQNSRHLRVSGGSSTNTRSQPNSIPRGRPNLWL